MGMRQLKMQLGAETTAGSAVIEYGGEVSTELDGAAEAADDMDMVDIDPVITIDEVDDAARAKELKERRARSFMAGEESILAGGIGVRREFEACGIDLSSSVFFFESWESNAIEGKRTLGLAKGEK
jgi:hypothetical protein